MITGPVITVRYAGPTNSRGSRWIATADHPIGRAVVGYDYALSSGLENAETAAAALVARWNVDNRKRYPDAAGTPSLPDWTLAAGGHTRDGYAFVAAYAR